MKLSPVHYIDIVQILSESDEVPDIAKTVLKEMRVIIQDLIHEKFMLECDILDIEDALIGKELTWNSPESAKRCGKILELLHTKSKY
jgi:hypothetical protein